ncbi:hypothetical protein GLOIN_2v1495186 [Rhizophagus irregularis DAOM 181602=DAOM 197198]|uniref:CCHC-type domain-containing protein n=1 Tax=Rhizophagus irregularis (strain DAOM 181602 / DAOM 197198 / MUCL 43194) TaxID=747089 RepID=A0A2P4QXW3_RHIID|nr:hypothetical protein GLOIN_2v1495186 [Rhizophagus irregularis DAOM 181602=DAOM 197198]POG82467.1 hypothetical protein GLOIN_2v1495186 [Rhizophagus irregularis DAOM 181602=DAOM 197198]|eukprot:XP_025189333.1 hypothetical protein GLOIN_2v1495186 [Rhizophagus irregularis DAOM 181602=DAOM 197198]
MEKSSSAIHISVLMDVPTNPIQLRILGSTEIPKPKIRNQRHCRKCGKVGHYQKNCKE